MPKFRRANTAADIVALTFHLLVHFFTGRHPLFFILEVAVGAYTILLQL